MKQTRGVISTVQLDVSGMKGFAPDLQKGEGYGEAEAAGTDAPRVEIEDPGAAIGGRFVGVPEDDGLKTPGRVEIEAGDVVEDVQMMSPGRDNFGFGEGCGPGAVVGIAAHGVNGGYLPEGIEDVLSPDVAGVNNEVAPPEKLRHLRAKQTVGVGNHSDQQLLPAVCGDLVHAGFRRRARTSRISSTHW